MVSSLSPAAFAAAFLVTLSWGEPLLEGQSKEGPDKVLRQMEERLSRAMSVTVDATAGAETSAPWKGTLSIEDGRFDLDVTGEVEGVQTRIVATINAGMLQVTWMNHSKKTTHTEIKGAPPNLRPWTGVTFARSGLSGVVSAFAVGRPLEAIIREIQGDKPAAATSLKAGPKERISDVDAQTLEYALKTKDSSSQVKLWWDAAKALPLRRTITTLVSGKPQVVKENYDFTTPEERR